MKEKGLRHIGDIVDGILARVGTGGALELARLVEDWSGVAGPAWTAARPVRLRDGELLVEVDNGAAASLLRFQVPDLLRDLDAGLGEGVVDSVVLRVARRGGPRTAG
jgi:hypothetical protein